MLKIGHRGAPGYEPENTLRSFTKALELGVDMIEFDVRVCKGGDLIISHESTPNDAAGNKELIENLTLAELKQYDVGKGERIPTLTEALDLINRRAMVNIELKGENTAGPVATVVKNYTDNKEWAPESFLVSSFNHREFVKFAKINPGARLGVLVRKNLFSALVMAFRHRAYSIHIHHHFLWKWLVRVMQFSGFKVFAFWLPNEEWEKRAKKIGVDGIFSDYPDRI